MFIRVYILLLETGAQKHAQLELAWATAIAPATEKKKVLQCVAVQCTAVCCSVLHCFALCCSRLQCVAVRCSVLQLRCIVLHCGAVGCSALQCSAVWGSDCLMRVL